MMMMMMMVMMTMMIIMITMISEFRKEELIIERQLLH